MNPGVMAYPAFEQPWDLGQCSTRNKETKRELSDTAQGHATAERNYHLHSGKLEFFALKWAITDKFRDYLFYAPSSVAFTGNNPLSCVMTSAKRNATGQRWVAELADHNQVPAGQIQSLCRHSFKNAIRYR